MSKVNIGPAQPWTVTPQKTGTAGGAHQAAGKAAMKTAHSKTGLSQPAQMKKNLRSESKLKVYGAAGTTGK